MCSRYISTRSLGHALWLTLLFCSGAYGASFEQLLSPGPLSAAHEHLSEECGSCHDPLGERTQLELCTTCHEDVAADIERRTGLHGKHPEVAGAECQTCHREHEGVNAETLRFDLSRFDHKAADFELHGAHIGLACASCHTDDQPFSAAPTECATCHASDDPHADTLSQACDACHGTSDWQPSVFDHALTGFPLTGAHEGATCASCHAETPQFPPTPTECAACHTKDDPHRGAFGADCASCHFTTSWTQTGFDHASTGFVLEGVHASLPCASCHSGEDHSGAALGSTCNACHAKDDPHDGLRGTDCASCHSQTTWQAVFDHEARTGFPLIGAHADLACKTCHVDGTDAEVPTTCEGCHTPDPHDGQLGGDCAQCHNERSFVSSVRFNHHFSHFPLLGAHSVLACADCHESSRFKDATAECGACHAEDDVHEGAMGTQCGACHNPADWQHTRFDHGEHSGFELTGAHANLACKTCHVPGITLDVAEESSCRSCHARRDPHQGAFGSDCARCHITDSFSRLKVLQ